MFPPNITHSGWAGYNPFGPHAQPAPANAIPLANFKAAQLANATHISATGHIAYDQREYACWRSFWDNESKTYGSWFRCDELPGDAVKLDGD